jgi:MFS family permease
MWGKRVRNDLLILGIGLIVSGFILISLGYATLVGSVLSPSVGLAFLAFASFWIGLVFTIIGIPVTIYGIIAEPKSPTVAPKIKAGKQKIVVVEEPSEDNFGFMTSIIAGIVLVVIGIMAKMLTVDSDSRMTTAIGNSTLIAFVVMGILIIGFGVADHFIDKKRE